MEKINLVELLRDCPTGMELDCTVFDNVTFDYVNTEQNRIYCKIDKRDTVWFTAKGCINLAPSAKCVIFPKGKTTWEGFVPPYQFKDGDVVAITMKPEGMWIGIFKQHGETSFESHCYLNTIGEFKSKGLKNHSLRGFRFATEEEKQILFDVIRTNGYKWNAETKTLVKLIEPNFKVGDRIRHKEKTKWACTIARVEDRYYVDGHPTCYTLPFDKQDEYELIPNKFDITTLKAFESRVLVRDYDNRMWIPTFLGKRLADYSNCRYLTTNGFYRYCIPYEGNEHLLGTTYDCDDFYKTWE